MLLQPPGLRAQLALIGLTGQQVVLLDFFDPLRHPVPKLPFEVPARTIPATSSTLQSIESSLEASAEGLPGLVGAVRSAAEGLRSALEPFRHADLAPRAATTLRRADDALASIQRFTTRLSGERTPEQITHAVAELDAAVSSLRVLLDGAASRNGLVSSAQQAADALTETARSSNALGRELDETLRQTQGALLQIRRLAESIDRDPDMLLKGRAQGER